VVRKGFCGRCSAQGVQNGGGGRDRWVLVWQWWYEEEQSWRYVCSATAESVREGCGGCSGRSLRACVRPVYLQGRITK
jgi:hypothetical protein